MYLVSKISGSKAADTAAVAPILFREMRKRGAHPGEPAAMLATSSAMSETIPPSLVLVTIGWRRSWPYIGALVAALIIVAAFSWLSIGFLR